MTIASIRKDLRKDESSEEEFSISDLSSLGWLIRRIGELEKQIAEIEEAKRQEIEEITERAAFIAQPFRDQILYFMEKYTPQAEAFVKGQIKGRKAKSIPTLWGRAGFRKSRAGVRITDAEDALAFAKTHKIPTKVTESVLKRPLLNHIEETGEVPTGTEYVPSEERFYVRYAPRSEDILNEPEND